MATSGSREFAPAGAGKSADAALHPGAVPRVEALLQQQQGLFTRLDALSDQQAALIEREETDCLLAVLAQRQVIIEEIARISAELEPWRAKWSDFVTLLPETDRRRVRERVDAVAVLAERIATRDERDRKLMESRKGAIAAELGQVNRGRGAIAAYNTGATGGAAAKAAPAPRFQDREA